LGAGRYLLVGGGIAAIAVLILLAIGLYSGTEVREVASPTEPAAPETRTTESRISTQTPEHSKTVTSSTEGRKGILYVLVVPEEYEKSTLYEADVLNNRSKRLEGAPTPVASFDLDDGGSIYYSNFTTILRLKGPEPEVIVSLNSDEGTINTVRVGPDGRIYFSLILAQGPGYILKVLDGGETGLVFNVTDDFVERYLAGRWSGEFDLDEEGNLYLSSGNAVPSSLVVVSGNGSVRTILNEVDLVTTGLRHVSELTLVVGDQRIDLSDSIMFCGQDGRVYFIDRSRRELHYLKLPKLPGVVVEAYPNP